MVQDCQLIITDASYARDSDMVTQSLCALAGLSKDSFRVCSDGCIFEEFDILGMVSKQVSTSGLGLSLS